MGERGERGGGRGGIIIIIIIMAFIAREGSAIHRAISMTVERGVWTAESCTDTSYMATRARDVGGKSSGEPKRMGLLGRAVAVL